MYVARSFHRCNRAATMMFVNLRTIKHLTVCIALLFATHAVAGEQADITQPEFKPEIWINPGFYSWHFETNIGLKDANPGLGMEYRYSATQSIMGGRYGNSDHQISSYMVWLWQPLTLGKIRLGALAGLIDGYPQAFHGDWFLMAIPVASYEYGNAGINLTIVPTIPDMVHGSFTVQLKYRIL